MTQAAGIPLPCAEPQARTWYAEMLLGRDGAGAGDRACALLEEGARTYAALGMPGLERWARERLASLSPDEPPEIGGEVRRVLGHGRGQLRGSSRPATQYRSCRTSRFCSALEKDEDTGRPSSPRSSWPMFR